MTYHQADLIRRNPHMGWPIEDVREAEEIHRSRIREAVGYDVDAMLASYPRPQKPTLWAKIKRMFGG